MYIRRQQVRIVEGANAQEPGDRTGTCVMAPNGHPAFAATRDLLPQATGRGGVNQFRLCCKIGDPVRLDHRVQRERGSGFALTPAAVAAVNYQWLRLEAVADQLAVTAAFGGKWRVCRHGGGSW